MFNAVAVPVVVAASVANAVTALAVISTSDSCIFTLLTVSSNIGDTPSWLMTSTPLDCLDTFIATSTSPDALLTVLLVSVGLQILEFTSTPFIDCQLSNNTGLVIVKFLTAGRNTSVIVTVELPSGIDNITFSSLPRYTAISALVNDASKSKPKP